MSVYICDYNSPLGIITIACDESAVTGLWFEGQKHFGSTLSEEMEYKDTDVLKLAKQWDIILYHL